MPSLADRFWAKVRKTDGCWLWIGSRAKRGYGKIQVGVRSANGHPVAEYAHRVSWQLHKGEIPVGQLVMHKCDNPSCVRPDHLFVGSYQDNTDDMYAKGREARGANIHGKLSDDAVRQIRSLSGTQREIAARFGVSQAQISLIRTRRQWTHV